MFIINQMLNIKNFVLFGWLSIIIFLAACSENDFSVESCMEFSKIWPEEVEHAFLIDTSNIRNPPYTQKELLEDLKAKRFDELETKLVTIQKMYEQGELPEQTPYRAFQTFRIYDKPIEGLLDEWIKSSPSSFAARGARGYYLVSKARFFRGTTYYSKIPPENLKPMHFNLNAATIDFQHVLALKPTFMPAYSRLVEIAMITGNDELAEKTLNDALSIKPDAYYVRTQYMRHLEPRWGGSYILMENFAKDAQIQADSNPRLKALPGFIYAYKGLKLYQKDKYKEMAKKYTEALRHGPIYEWFEYRAWAYQELGASECQLADLTEQLRY